MKGSESKMKKLVIVGFIGILVGVLIMGGIFIENVTNINKHLGDRIRMMENHLVKEKKKIKNVDEKSDNNFQKINKKIKIVDSLISTNREMLNEVSIQQIIYDNIIDEYVKTPSFIDLQKATVEIICGKVGGTGTIYQIDENYIWILTAKHVVKNSDKYRVVVNLNDDIQEFFEIENSNIFKADNLDLSIIRLKKPIQKVSAINISKKIPAKGSEIYTVGHPYCFHYTIQRGIVSNYIKRKYNDSYNYYMLISAPTFPGNSGGMVVNRQGQIVGVVVGIIYNVEGFIFQDVEKYPSLAVAIKLEDIKNFINQTERVLETHENP